MSVGGSGKVGSGSSIKSPTDNQTAVPKSLPGTAPAGAEKPQGPKE